MRGKGYPTTKGSVPQLGELDGWKDGARGRAAFGWEDINQSKVCEPHEDFKRKFKRLSRAMFHIRT